MSAAPADDAQAQRLRPLNQPRPIRVRVDSGEAPVAVGAGRRWLAVQAVLDRWRIDDRWWRRPVSRMYYELLLADGRTRTVYRDLRTGAWFAQRG